VFGAAPVLPDKLRSTGARNRRLHRAAGWTRKSASVRPCFFQHRFFGRGKHFKLEPARFLSVPFQIPFHHELETSLLTAITRWCPAEALAIVRRYPSSLAWTHPGTDPRKFIPKLADSFRVGKDRSGIHSAYNFRDNPTNGRQHCKTFLRAHDARMHLSAVCNHSRWRGSVHTFRPSNFPLQLQSIGTNGPLRFRTTARHSETKSNLSLHEVSCTPKGHYPLYWR